MNEIEKVISIAEAEVGYLEKKTNSQLDSKTANAGYGNYTKYARDLDNIKNFYNGKKNGYAWCDIFVDWCFVKAFGKERAMELLNQPERSTGAGCYFSMNFYKKSNQFHTSPQKGDQIFFQEGGEITHTGLVYKVDNSKVYTIEGNTSSKAGVVANGGAVAKKSYYLNSSYIAGYGRPKYNKSDASSNASTSASPQKESAYTTFVKEVQKACGASVDGIAGPETLSKTVTVSKNKNRRHKVVKPIQKYLISLGYSLPKYGADGDCGDETTSAIKKYQKANGCIVDGEITAGNKTWKKLLKLE